MKFRQREFFFKKRESTHEYVRRPKLSRRLCRSRLHHRIPGRARSGVHRPACYTGRAGGWAVEYAGGSYPWCWVPPASPADSGSGSWCSAACAPGALCSRCTGCSCSCWCAASPPPPKKWWSPLPRHTTKGPPGGGRRTTNCTGQYTVGGTCATEAAISGRRRPFTGKKGKVKN